MLSSANIVRGRKFEVGMGENVWRPCFWNHDLRPKFVQRLYFGNFVERFQKVSSTKWRGSFSAVLKHVEKIVAVCSEDFSK